MASSRPVGFPPVSAGMSWVIIGPPREFKFTLPAGSALGWFPTRLTRDTLGPGCRSRGRIATAVCATWSETTPVTRGRRSGRRGAAEADGDAVVDVHQAD